jgi:protein-disulfide isomerase
MTTLRYGRGPQIAAVFLLALIVVATVLAATRAGAGGTTPSAKPQQAGIPEQGLTLGDPTAPATLVEFADPQCPFSSRS